MAYRVLTNLYDELYPVASGALDNWTNPFTGASGTISGLSLFLQGDAETAWHEDFLKNLYLIDYYITYIVDTSGQTNRAASGAPILVGDSVYDRLDYAWDIVKRSQTAGTSGTIQTAIDRWGEQLTASGAIDGDQYNSYSTLFSTSGELPKLTDYIWGSNTYWDNYEGTLVSIYDLPVGGYTDPNTSLTGLAVNLSTDADIDPLAAPTISGQYMTNLSGADAYLSQPSSVGSFYSDTFPAVADLRYAALWADDTGDGVLNDASGTVVNPNNPTWAADDLIKGMILNTAQLASGTLNIISRDVGQKIMVYTTRKLNHLHRRTYGSIGGFQTDIPNASGTPLAFDFTLENGGDITPSGGAAWPVVTNPFASGELNPSGSALMYSPDTPDFHWRKLINEMDVNLDNPNDYGSMPWLLSQMRYMRYRMYQLVGRNARQKGGRLWRATMPVSGASYATFADLPQPGDSFFATTVTRDESDGTFYVDADKTWYYWDDLTSAWRIAWSIDATTASGEFPNVPDAFGIVIGKGVTGLPSYEEDWTSAQFRTYYPGPPASGEWHVAPGADIYSRVAEQVLNTDAGDKIVDQAVVNQYGINLDGWTDSNNPNLLGFDIDQPVTQFVTQFKNFHSRLGSLPAAALMPGKTMSDIQADNFLETILYSVPPSGQFSSGTYVQQLAAVLDWHEQSVGELNVGELDVGDRPGTTLAEALTLDILNKMDYVEYTTGDGTPAGQLHPTPSGILARFIGPHQLTFVDDDDPGFYGGVRLTYFDEDAES